MNIIDHHEREVALDTNASFIVQAPAGSGKTELLTQRYLALLAKAQAPEEIIAITFTRKAAAEMQARILDALQSAAENTNQPLQGAAQQRNLLAQAVLKQNDIKQWDLLSNPSRLRILTIDAFCASLTRQMPILSHFGSEPNIANDTQVLYQKAAKAILQGLETAAPWAEKLECLLLHLDNDLQKVEALLCNMLARRDQWLPHIIVGLTQQKNLRKILEKSLQNVVFDSLQTLTTQLPAYLQTELTELAHLASEELQREESTSPIAFCHALTPVLNTTCTAEELDIQKNCWAGVAELLLTKDGDWRKTITKREGFPADSKHKNRIKNLIAELHAFEEWRSYLQTVRLLPPATYSDSQWQIITALVELLPILVAELHLLFQSYEAVDYIEISQSAFTALGDTDAPTDLALILDYQIQHILVDEFQDTSSSQFRLLEQLTAGWQPDDGRTLFLVGDPMQSIYRFRKAEVGLFLQACEHGLGSIPLQSLVLKVNFRSSPTIVNWVNQTFAALMPQTVDLGSGAVPFSASHAHQTQSGNVQLHALRAEHVYQEAHHIVKIIQTSLQEDPKARIAILVRARNDLTDIIPVLQTAKIAYRAVEIESLAQRRVVQDLFALTRALLHPADRIAWLSVLRAPWCGLTLNELHQLAGENQQQTILEKLQQINFADSASNQNLQRTAAILLQSLQQRGRISLSNWIYGTWLALGGPASCKDEIELTDAKAFFKLLQTLQANNPVIDLEQLQQRLRSLFAAPQTAENIAVDIMTIHKAKGLEFEVVILPGLEGLLPNDDSQLLLYMERAAQSGTDLLLAPIKASDEDKDPIYQYLRYEDKQRAVHESTRLLYVAATRAKLKLHLLATLKYDEFRNEYKAPSKNCLLAQLWPTYGEEFLAHVHTNTTTDLVNQTINIDYSQLKRFAANWQLPATPAGFVPQFIFETIPSRGKNHFYSWSNNMMRHVGTVTHKILQKISQQGLSAWDINTIATKRAYYQHLLLHCGIPHTELEPCLLQIETALKHAVTDPRGRWILDHQSEAQSELALTAMLNGETIHSIIDRTFVDEKNIRWIIDYKTIAATENIIEQIERETKNYRSQLEQYAKIMRLQDPDRVIRLGLYFPLQKAWREWEYKD